MNKVATKAALRNDKVLELLSFALVLTYAAGVSFTTIYWIVTSYQLECCTSGGHVAHLDVYMLALNMAGWVVCSFAVGVTGGLWFGSMFAYTTISNRRVAKRVAKHFLKISVYTVFLAVFALAIVMLSAYALGDYVSKLKELQDNQTVQEVLSLIDSATSIKTNLSYVILAVSMVLASLIGIRFTQIAARLTGREPEIEEVDARSAQG